MSRNSEYKRASHWIIASGLRANSGLAEVIWKTLLVWAWFPLTILPSTSALTYNTSAISPCSSGAILAEAVSGAELFHYVVTLQCGEVFRRDHSLNERRVIESPGPIQSLIFFFKFIILFYFFLRQLIQGAITVVILLWFDSQLTVRWRDVCLFHIKPHYGAMLSSHYWTETDLTLEMKIQIVKSHPVYPSISKKTTKHSACGMIYKTKALQVLILNHGNWTTYRQADFFWSRSDEFQLLLRVFKRSP